MRKSILIGGIAAAALMSTTAMAQSSCERHRSGRVVGTVVGAGVGGVLGNVIAGKGDKTLGTIIGAVGGGVIGNQVAKPSGDCKRAYGYYDKDNRWHATGIDAQNATGYYDRDDNWVEGQPTGGSYGNDGYYVPAGSEGYYDRNDVWVARAANVTRREDAYGYYDNQGMWHASNAQRGRATGYYNRNNDWVEGTPNGRYDAQGRWVSHSGSGQTSGYYNAQGRWIPASSGGYYDSNDRWIAGSASGYYNSRGRWVAGPTTGRYDANGRWMPGEQAGQRGADGRWIEGVQPGYYTSNGRWVPGQTTGYYDNRGRWVSTGVVTDMGAQAPIPREVRARLTWMDSYIRSASSQGTLSRAETDRSLRELTSIRTSERSMPRNRRGELSVRNEAAIQVRLDRLSDRLRITGEMSQMN